MEHALDMNPPTERRWPITRPTVLAAAWYVGLLLGASAVLYGGIKLRWRLYTDTAAFRFHGDIDNGWGQGSAIYRDVSGPLRRPVSFGAFFKSFLHRYDELAAGSNQGDYGLDYPPARLLIMSSWVWHARHTIPTRRPTPADMSIAAPLLRLNTTMEALAATLAFLIVRRVSLFRGFRQAETLGLCAALSIWFNPAILIDGHIWPQWDVWLLPFYLGAVYLALRKNWLWCGACLGLGVMFKGQLLSIAPVFVLWPLFGGRWRAALDVLIGFLLASMLVVSPWMLGSRKALVMALILALLLVVGVYYLPPRYRVRSALAGTGLTIVFSGLWFGSISWFYIGFAYATHHYMNLTNGTIPNLAAMLGNEFGFGLNDRLFDIQRLHLVVTVRFMLFCLHVAALIICGIALALQDRRGNVRLLLALALPCLTMGALLPQLHERYLLWAGVVSALAVGVSLGTALLHLLLALLAAMPIATALLSVRNNGLLSPQAQHTAQQWLNVLNHCWPSNAWAVLLVMLVMMYLALTPGESVLRASGTITTSQ